MGGAHRAQDAVRVRRVVGVLAKGLGVIELLLKSSYEITLLSPLFVNTALRLPCPVGHYACYLSCLTFPLLSAERGILQHLYRFVTDTGLRALRDLRVAGHALILQEPPPDICRCSYC